MSEEIPAPYSYPEPPPLRRQPIAWVTWTIVVSTVAVFLLQLLYLHLKGDDILGNTLAFSPEAFAEGRYWTLVTYAWAHAVVLFNDPGLFWLHLVSNMIPLICLGPALERFIGAWRYLGLYVGGAIFSALVWYFFNSSDNEPIIGASGAVFALIVAAGTAAPRTRIVVYLLYILPIPMTLWMLAVVACVIEVACILFGWMPEIAHTAHLGGAAFGFLYLLTLRLLWRRHGLVD